MKQIYVDPAFPFPNYWHGENTCNVTVAHSDDKQKLLIVFAQRQGEWANGTSAINQAEVIVGKIMQEIIPTLQKEWSIPKSCELVWVVEVITGTDELYNAIRLVEVNAPRITFLDRLLGKPPVTPKIEFGRVVSPSDYPSLIGE